VFNAYCNSVRNWDASLARKRQCRRTLAETICGDSVAAFQARWPIFSTQIVIPFSLVAVQHNEIAKRCNWYQSVKFW
jgi:hypothetical protein